MPSEDERQDLIQRTFRRDSLKEHGVEVIEAWRIPGIFGQMGQPFDEEKLNAAIKKLDPKGCGKLTEEAYNELCEQFVNDPAALAKFQGDGFTFKHLINLKDFATP